MRRPHEISLNEGPCSFSQSPRHYPYGFLVFLFLFLLVVRSGVSISCFSFTPFINIVFPRGAVIYLLSYQQDHNYIFRLLPAVSDQSHWRDESLRGVVDEVVSTHGSYRRLGTGGGAAPSRELPLSTVFAVSGNGCLTPANQPADHPLFDHRG